MSAPLSVDAYDAQMLDFSSDPDVTMNITGSAEFFAEALMDHDGHLSTSTYGEHPSVEVDMEEYVGDNAEYEMADETSEYHRLHGDEPLDVEVYDASHVPSPLVPPQSLQPAAEVPIDPEHSVHTPPSLTESATLPDLQGKPQSEVHPTAPVDNPAPDAPHVESLTPGEGVSSEALPSSESVHPTDAPDESIHPVSESHEQLGDAGHTIVHSYETPTPTDAANETAPHAPLLIEERPVDSQVAQHQISPELSTAESAPVANAEEAYDDGLPRDEKAPEQTPATEGEFVDPLHISDDVYIDPPPAVLLSIADPAQPGFVLFNHPEEKGEVTGERHGNQESHSLLLEDQPTLYYEPLSSVFDALRQDEALVSRVPHSFEGELVLEAYDLQLAVSEDNVHSREISLHDLNILHDGSDFAGPLRLLLRAAVPRFIMRYYALQEQIQRLNVVAEPAQGEHEQEHHEEYQTNEEHHTPQQEETVDTTHTAVVSDELEAPLTTAAEESAKELVCLSELTEETPEENYDPEDTSGAEEPAAEFHGVAGEATRALEDEGEYEDTNVGNEDESANSESPSAGQVPPASAEDTDTPTAVPGQGSEFGGEQAEYSDYVQPEEYDERYGEDLPERTGGASPVQYGEPPHYEEAEQDTLTVADGTQAVLPGLDADEEKSTATPVPVRAVLEPEVSEPADKHATDEPVLPDKDSSVPRSEAIATSESANEVVLEQASGNQETDTAQAKIFSEIDESDSNFVSILEREANAEFDRSFNAEQNEQEGSIETALQHESNWDEWDDEDAEGEDEEDWIDPDAASNESSITLSSKASSKRNYDEVDPSEEIYVEDPHASPGSKRPRVQ